MKYTAEIEALQEQLDFIKSGQANSVAGVAAKYKAITRLESEIAALKAKQENDE